MARRLTSRVGGAVHDIERIGVLSGNPTNIRVLSDKTLYVLQNLSGEDITFLSRYGASFSGGYYSPVLAGSDEAGTVEGTVDIIRRDLTSMAIEETLECLCVQLQGILGALSKIGNSTQSCDVGSDFDTDSGEEGGGLPGPVNGVEYTAATAIDQRKCLAANYIHQSIVSVVSELLEKRADTYAGVGLAFILPLVTTIIGGAIVAGPFGVLVGAVAGGLLSLALLLLKSSFSLELLLSAIEADEPAAICALYEASSAEGARAAYIAHALGQGATSLETQALSLMIPNNALNLLFFAWGDSESAIAAVTPTYDCSGCAVGGCQWEFSTEFPGVPTGSGSLLKDGSERTLTAELHTDGYYRIYIELDTVSGNPGQDCDGEVQINSEIVINAINPPGTEGAMGERTIRWWGSGIWNTGTLPFPISSDPDVDIAQMWLSHTSPFTIDCELTPGNVPS